MSSPLTRFQDGFSRALLAPADAPPAFDLAAQPGFAVYRNTVLKGWCDALQANYPAVARLVGDRWFRAAAVEYSRSHPPRDPSLLDFGEGFAAFLARFEPAAQLCYLADVARIDRLWTESHGACDAPCLEPAMIAGLSPERLAERVLRPHPAARWAWFGEQPIYTIWKRNREATEAAAPLDWHGEGVLLTRPAGIVRWTRLDAGGCAFLDACAAGRRLAEAAARAIGAHEAVDLGQLMAQLLESGAFDGGNGPEEKRA